MNTHNICFHEEIRKILCRYELFKCLRCPNMNTVFHMQGLQTQISLSICCATRVITVYIIIHNLLMYLPRVSALKICRVQSLKVQAYLGHQYLQTHKITFLLAQLSASFYKRQSTLSRNFSSGTLMIIGKYVVQRHINSRVLNYSSRLEGWLDKHVSFLFTMETCCGSS